MFHKFGKDGDIFRNLKFLFRSILSSIYSKVVQFLYLWLWSHTQYIHRLLEHSSNNWFHRVYKLDFRLYNIWEHRKYKKLLIRNKFYNWDYIIYKLVDSYTNLYHIGEYNSLRILCIGQYRHNYSLVHLYSRPFLHRIHRKILLRLLLCKLFFIYYM